MRITNRFFRLHGAILIALFFGAAPRVLAQETNAASETNAPIATMAADDLEPREVQLASQAPSGNATEDTIYLKWYPAKNAARLPAPAVILLHPLGRQDQSPMHEYARYLSQRGIAAAVVTLPYHGKRLPKGDETYRHFIGGDPKLVEAAARQSELDVRTVTDWMVAQPNVDAKRLGGIGISLGALALHVAMGQDARLVAGVAALGGGDLARIQRGGSLSAEDLARLEKLDPMAYAANNLPRHVLMIQAARDNVVPPQSAELLWNALGKPPIQWLDTNHFSPINFGKSSILRASIVYSKRGLGQHRKRPRKSRAFMRRLSNSDLLSGLDSHVTPAIQWQFYGVGTLPTSQTFHRQRRPQRARPVSGNRGDRQFLHRCRRRAAAARRSFHALPFVSRRLLKRASTRSHDKSALLAKEARFIFHLRVLAYDCDAGFASGDGEPVLLKISTTICCLSATFNCAIFGTSTPKSFRLMKKFA